MADTIRKDSLVLYKKHPARVAATGEKLELEIQGGGSARVRHQDVTLLHPGPLLSLGGLRPLSGEVEAAWGMLAEAGEPVSLKELAELAFDSFTPAAAWAAWQLVEDGLYFHGTPQAILARPAEEVERTRSIRQAKAAEAQAWEDFIERARSGQVERSRDGRFLREVEDLANGRRKDSRVLQTLGRSERPESAHAALLEWSIWDTAVNPHPVRLGLPLHPPQAELPALPDEERLDLTGLPAFAIDDRHNQDPDDAISLGELRLDAQGNFLGGRLWIHIADAAALVPPGSPADLEARARGATLYLPEGPVTMLPGRAVELLGLGLQEISPALSFGIELNAAAEISAVQIAPSWVKVQRLNYEDADGLLNAGPLHDLYRITQAYQKRRMDNGALMIDLPEVMLRVTGGQVAIEPVLRTRSRSLVREAMILAGEAAARFAIEQGLPFPYATQPAPELPKDMLSEGGFWRGAGPSNDPAEMARRFGMRRFLKRSQVSSLPAPHAGVGVAAYSRATSPLRRCLDLVAHQQLRRFLAGQPPLGEQEIIERIGAAEAVTGLVGQGEYLSRRHWTLVYLQQHPGWQAEAALVDRNGGRGFLIIPELALEAPVHLRENLPVGSALLVTLQGLNLAELDVHFQAL